MKKLSQAFAVAAASFLLFANLAFAADLVGPKNKEDANVTIGAEDAHHNLYAGAATLTSNGNITGDAYIGGGTVMVNGNVEQDLVVGGGNLVLNGQVGGDLRTGGGTVTINGPVKGDVLVAGGSVSLTDKASVGADLMAAGGSIDISAPITGKVRISGGTITINSKIDGDVWITAGEKLTFGPKAAIAGKVYYSGPQQANVEQGAQVPNVQYTYLKNNHRGAEGAFRALFTGAVLIKLLGWIIAVLLLIKLMPAKTSTAISIAHSKPWASLGIGFLALVATPIAVIILFITLVGYYVAFALLVTYVTLIVFSSLIGALFLGNLIMKWLMKKPGPLLDWQSAVIGVAVYVILGLIPVVGWLACALLMLISFGSLVQVLKRESGVVAN